MYIYIMSYVKHGDTSFLHEHSNNVTEYQNTAPAETPTCTLMKGITVSISNTVVPSSGALVYRQAVYLHYSST